MQVILHNNLYKCQLFLFQELQHEKPLQLEHILLLRLNLLQGVLQNKHHNPDIYRIRLHNRKAFYRWKRQCGLFRSFLIWSTVRNFGFANAENAVKPIITNKAILFVNLFILHLFFRILIFTLRKVIMFITYYIDRLCIFK